LDHTASSVARCIRLAREGQSEALSRILGAYRNDLEWEEVAVRMGRSADAVRMLWTRAVRRLGDQLGEEEP
jgi:DNA-directed RNA polymerase specialized sigma24 family protein